MRDSLNNLERKLMNLGVYIKDLAATEEVEHLVANITKAVEDGSADDASIFYESVGKHPVNIKCGCFNSTDLWNFTGNLIVTSIDSARTAINIVNKFKVYFYYKWYDEKDLMGLMSVVNHPRVVTICRTEKDAAEIYRLTGNRPEAVVENFDIEQVLEVF